jgi:hypothetical protein
MEKLDPTSTALMLLDLQKGIFGVAGGPHRASIRRPMRSDGKPKSCSIRSATSSPRSARPERSA